MHMHSSFRQTNQLAPSHSVPKFCKAVIYKNLNYKSANIIKWGKEQSFQKMLWKQLIIHMQKNKVGPLP